MIRAAAFAVILSLFSLPTYAQTWLCIGEYAAVITQDYDDLRLIESKTFSPPTTGAVFRFLVDENGVRLFGEDNTRIEQCQITVQGIIFCQEDKGMVDQFFMGGKGLFRLLLTSVNDDKAVFAHQLIMGKCSKL